jgi:hypothetical protein
MVSLNEYRKLELQQLAKAISLENYPLIIKSFTYFEIMKTHLTVF